MSELGVKTLTVGVQAGAQTVDTPVRVHVTEGPGVAGDPRSASVAVDWLPDGRLDVSRVLADARFATGLDSSIPPAPLPLPRINVRWVDGLDADRRRGLEARFGFDAGEGESSTWSYGLADASRENITALVRHPDVEDTHYIDRVEMTLEAGAFRAAAPRYRAPSQERVPRLYVLAVTVTGVAADDLRPEDIDLVFVNTVTGQEVEARRVAAHDLGDGPSGDRPTALPAGTGRRGMAGGAPAPGYPPDRPGRTAAAAWRVSSTRTSRPATGLQPAHRVRHRPPAWRRRRAAGSGVA